MILNQKSLSESKVRFMSDTDCFVYDTEIYLSTGHYMKIGEMYNSGLNLSVCAYDNERDCFKNCNADVKLTRRNAELCIVRYWIENGAHSEIEVKYTPNHKFLVWVSNTERKWLEAKDLKRGMYLVNDEHDWDIVVYKDTELIDERDDVYCLNVEDTHTFEIVHGVVTSC